MRVTLIILFFGLINTYAAARIIDRWPWAGQHAPAAWLLALAFFILQLAGPFGDRLVFPKLKKKPGGAALVLALDWLSYMAFGVMSILVIYELVIDVVSLFGQIFFASFNLPVFDHDALLFICLATLCTTVAGFRQVIRGPRVQNVEIRLENLPAGFDGFKIVQVSDLHVGPMIRRRYTENVVNIVNALNPDLIALTGDFVDGSVEDLIDDVAPLSTLDAPCGTFFVTGNHEYYSGASGWLQVFKDFGAQDLVNEHAIIRHNDAAIVLAGVTDYRAKDIIPAHASDPVKALAGAPAGLVKILLAHQPASYTKAEEAGFNLQLSGHTHAGQYFPFTFLIRFFQRYYKGLNRYKKMWIYVNRGTGYWGPPLRTGAPCEITLITLRR